MLAEADSVTVELGYENLLSQKLSSLKKQGNYRYFLPLKKSVENQPAFSAIPTLGTEGVSFIQWIR